MGPSASISTITYGIGDWSFGSVSVSCLIPAAETRISAKSDYCRAIVQKNRMPFEKLVWYRSHRQFVFPWGSKRLRMTQCRTLIVYKSVHHHNTAKVAAAIAEVLHADLHEPEDVASSK